MNCTLYHYFDWRLPPVYGPIQPLIVGDNAQAVALSQKLEEAGLWVPAIRPPTVPAGTDRLRITLSAGHCAAWVCRLLDAFRPGA